MITVIIKTTDGCNLRCNYCSMGKKSGKTIHIDADTLKNIGDYIVERCDTVSDSRIKIIMHGGEPTIVDSSIYREFFLYMERYSDRYDISYAFQTNGYFMSEDYLKLFSDYDVSVGVSFDGDRKVHDSVRVNSEGMGTFERIKSNIIQMKGRGIDVSALIVVTKDLLSTDLSYINFFNYNDIDIRINPLLRCGEAADNRVLWLEPGEYGKYVIDVYQYMLENDLDIIIEPIHDMMNAIINDGEMHECSYKKCCGKDIFSVDYNGDVYPCGRFCNVSEGLLGNIKKGNEIQEYVSDTELEECRTCRYVKWCNNGCDAYRKMSNANKSPLCDDIKIMCKYFMNEGLLAYIEYLKEQKAFLTGMLDSL